MIRMWHSSVNSYGERNLEFSEWSKLQRTQEISTTLTCTPWFIYSKVSSYIYTLPYLNTLFDILKASRLSNWH